MKHKIVLTIAAFVLTSATLAGADATLTYELKGADDSKSMKQFSVSQFFIRIDDSANTDQYLLFQAGKFFPLYSADKKNKSYARLTPKPAPYMSAQSRKHYVSDEAEGETKPKQTSENSKKPATPLKATKKSLKVAGIECRIVLELQDDKPAIEHCMANSARLGVTEREVISMARTFEMSRNRDLGWLGIGSRDETFISVQSKDLSTGRTLKLTSVSNKPLAEGYLRIPKEYKEVETGKQAPATK